MTDINDLKITIVDCNMPMWYALDLAFKFDKNVRPDNSYFCEFMKDDDFSYKAAKEYLLDHPDEKFDTDFEFLNHDCIVSPGNAFGKMDGTYDAAISDYLGWDFQLKVQDYIKENFYGEQPICTSFIIDTSKEGLKLIHTPTMRFPEKIKDERIPYFAFRSTLICALQNDVKNIVVPAFGGGCGELSPGTVSYMMKKAYDQIKNREYLKHLS